ncbi:MULTISPECIES: alpha/beta fold hydrolase [Tsukamurella]|uniref:Alpha/beta hydrolase n=2 Tax=Tsukamurella TaxID=2060 RepID=A0A5C5S1B8_9ACTN|nr:MULTISPECIES: alpha/beta fold hydrolase [Tsukamurella]NMD58264.1 alpha/beta hydrolase [Tsukamurella columbiensis]TWS28702.1 alpha/beta hydrolase [Tsukamurella conjunctivitidis]
MPEVSVPAGRVHYEEFGAGPPVVLLHGLLMDHTVWHDVLPLLPDGHRYVLPDLPLGAHPVPLNADADLSNDGIAHIIADFLDALDLRSVTLVHSDWGGGLLLTALGRDERVGRLVILPSTAFDNFPPGLPGRAATVAARLPGLRLGLRAMRIGAVRRLPILFGRMARDIPDATMRAWTRPAIDDPLIRRDLLKHARAPFDRADLTRRTEALRRFPGDALVLWIADGTVMPREHGRRLADLLRRGRLVELDDCYVLAMLDQPERVAAELAAFLAETTPARRD